MYWNILETCIFSFVLGLVLQALNLRVAHRYKLMDIPSARRRHPVPTPVTGGLGVVLTWLCSFGLIRLLQPDWFEMHSQSVFVLATAVVILTVLGMVDDLHGLSPTWKLSVETLV